MIPKVLQKSGMFKEKTKQTISFISSPYNIGPLLCKKSYNTQASREKTRNSISLNSSICFSHKIVNFFRNSLVIQSKIHINQENFTGRQIKSKKFASLEDQHLINLYNSLSNLTTAFPIKFNTDQRI